MTDFPSRPLDARIYDVTATIQLAVLPLGRGFIGIWLEGGKSFGYVLRFASPEQIEEHMRTVRDAHDPDAPRPVAIAPGGEPAMIAPQSNMLIEQMLDSASREMP